MRIIFLVVLLSSELSFFRREEKSGVNSSYFGFGDDWRLPNLFDSFKYLLFIINFSFRKNLGARKRKAVQLSIFSLLLSSSVRNSGAKQSVKC